MTNQEMALALGRYIIKLQNHITALEGVFLEYRVNTPDGPREIPVREMLKKVSEEEALQQRIAGQQHSLIQAVGGQTPDSSLIAVLHREFLEED